MSTAALQIHAPDAATFARIRESLKQHEVSDQIAGAISIHIGCEGDSELSIDGYILKPGPFVDEWREVLYDTAADKYLEEVDEPSETEKTVHCPKCASTDIREKNEAYTELPVLEWDIDPETGHPTPASYDEDSEPEWSAVDGPDIYACRVCGWTGDTDALVVRDAEPAT